MRLAILTVRFKGLGLALFKDLSVRGYRVIEFSRSVPHTGSIR